MRTTAQSQIFPNTLTPTPRSNENRYKFHNANSNHTQPFLSLPKIPRTTSHINQLHREKRKLNVSLLVSPTPLISFRNYVPLRRKFLLICRCWLMVNFQIVLRNIVSERRSLKYSGSDDIVITFERNSPSWSLHPPTWPFFTVIDLESFQLLSVGNFSYDDELELYVHIVTYQRIPRLKGKVYVVERQCWIYCHLEVKLKGLMFRVTVQHIYGLSPDWKYSKSLKTNFYFFSRCHSVYIGETGRSLEIRLSEYKRCLKSALLTLRSCRIFPSASTPNAVVASCYFYTREICPSPSLNKQREIRHKSIFYCSSQEARNSSRRSLIFEGHKVTLKQIHKQSLKQKEVSHSFAVPADVSSAKHVNTCHVFSCIRKEYQ